MREIGPLPRNVLIAVLTLSFLTHADDIAAERWQWEGVDRVVVLGDVHGELDKMTSLLMGTGLVDADLDWIAGNDHLVFVGDLVDRGPDDRGVMDLVRRLQSAALDAGGMVHVLLGNHEVMNMIADLRYVSPGGFAAFADQESKRDRSKALMRFRNTVFGPSTPLVEAREVFEQEFPPGYFARLRAFWFDGEYGSWLLQLPTVIKIDGVVFVHGGLTQDVASLGLEAINRQVREDVLEWMRNAQELYRISELPPAYSDVMRAALASEERPKDSSKKAEFARSVAAYHRTLPFTPGGPLWYRGNSLENERIERGRIERSLAALDARAIVIAHTPTGTGKITSRFDQTVYRVDVGMAYGRKPLALVIESDRFRVFDPESGSYGEPLPETPDGEGWSKIVEQLPDAQLEAFIRDTEASNCRFIQRGLRHAEVCELDGENMQMRIVFQDVDEQPGEVAEEPKQIPRSYRNEIASYRLDRLLELDMVPVTVAKSIDGRPGSAQLFLESAVDLPLIEIYEQFDLRDSLADQILEAQLFSALLGVVQRHKAGTMILPQEGRVAIADNTKAFDNSVELEPGFIPEVCGPIRPDLAYALRALSKSSLETVVGEYLSSKQLQALLGRRNRILERCSTG